MSEPGERESHPEPIEAIAGEPVDAAPVDAEPIPAEPADPALADPGENRLLKVDPRLRRPVIGADGEANPFAETEPVDATAGDSVYTPPPAEYAISYRPEYVAILPHRGRFHFTLACVALLVNAGAATYYLNYPYNVGFWIFPPIGLVASLVASWLSSGEIDAIRNGAMDRDGMPFNQRALWVAWAGFAVSTGILAWMFGRLLMWDFM